MNQKGQGWVLFASIALGISGVMRIFDGIWALDYQGTVPNALRGAVFGADLRTYGWIYLVEGIILILASIGVVFGSQVSRWIGIIAGSLVCISAILLMPYFPVWSIAYIILGILVVYGLSVYDGEALT